MTHNREHSDAENLRKFVEQLQNENSELKAALIESDDLYARMLHNLKEEFLFYRHDPQGRFTYISPSCLNILGFAPEEYLGRKTGDLWSPNPINEQADRATKLSCQGIKQPPYEMEIYHNSGKLRRFITIETPIFDNNGNVIAVEGSARDITEKRKTEEQLAKYRIGLEDLVRKRTEELEVSRKQLSDIIEFLPYPIWVVNVEERIIAWNRAMVELTEISTEAVIGKKYHNWISKFYNAKKDPILVKLVLDGYCQKKQKLDMEEIVSKTPSVKIEGRKILTERTIPHIDGTKRDFWITAGPILDCENKMIGVIESLRDITQKKQSERQLVQSQRRLSTLMNNLPGMAYRISLNDGVWKVDFVSEGCRLIFGREPGYFIDKHLQQLTKLIHEEDLPRVLEIAVSAIEKSKPFECEYRVYHGPYQTKWVFDKAEIISRNVDGRVSIEGFMVDFTVLKNKEEKLRDENVLLRSTIRDHYKFKNIIGNSQAMQDVYELIVKAATTDDNVFIYGESGTGKELVAQAIHEASNRKNNNFVAVNCAAIPESLIESEFFGTTKGAYTGADRDKKGYLETADQGTLFLDEIGDISPSLQVKLLRAIDGGGFSPVGSRNIIHPNLRIVAASNKDLQSLFTTGNIRKDFFFRIHVIPINLPPLRGRGDDIYLLVNHFLKQYGLSEGIGALSREELETLKKHRWSGNVRELQNVLRRYITLRNLHFMDDISELKKETASKKSEVVEELDLDNDLRKVVLKVEKTMITKTLEKMRWNRSRAAKELGISRRTLFRKMKSYGLD